MTNRCIFIATTWWGGDNSLALYHRALAEEIARRGWRVVMLVPGNAKAAAPDGNPAVYDWPSRRPTRLQDAAFLRKLILRHRPRCVLSSFGAVNVCTTVSRLLGVSHRLAWYHTLTSQIDIDWKQSQPKKRLLRLRKRLVYRMATKLIPVSEAAQRDLLGAFGVPARKCQVFYNSLPAPRIHLGSDVRDAGNVMCVGRLDAVKGQDVLIRAFARIAEELPGAQVHLAGSGPTEESLRKLADHLGIADRVNFLGALPPNEVLERLQLAAVSIVPSRSDNCPHVVIESLACGTPVIASAVGGIPEMLTDGEDALLVPPDDPGLLADRLQSVLSDHELSHRLSRGALAKFENQFDSARVVPRQVDWLLSEISSRQADTSD